MVQVKISTKPIVQIKMRLYLLFYDRVAAAHTNVLTITSILYKSVMDFDMCRHSVFALISKNSAFFTSFLKFL